MPQIFSKICAAVPKAPFVWNEFGGTVGGPIYIPHVYDGRNRTFFFAGYDGSRLRLGTTLNGNAPTPAQIAAATALVVGGRQITPNQLGLNILGVYSSLGLSGPFAVDNRGLQTPNSYVFKIDHKISDSDSLSARFLHGTGEDEFPGGGPGPGGGSQLSPWFGVTPTVADNFAISEVHIFNANLINTLRLGWNRFSQFQKGRDSNVEPNDSWLRHRSRSGQLRHARDRHRRHGYWRILQSWTAERRGRPRGNELSNR